jgi:hypothetical protein
MNFLLRAVGATQAADQNEKLKAEQAHDRIYPLGGKRRSKSHRKSHRKAHRKASRKASRKACRKASRKAHRKSCRCD